MALVRNTTHHPIGLSNGAVVGPHENRNILVTNYEQDLIDEGTLVVLDAFQDPPLPLARLVTVNAHVPYISPPVPFTLETDSGEPGVDAIGVDGLPIPVTGVGVDIRGRYRGDYQAGVHYRPDDLVTEDGKLWARNTDGTPGGAFDAGEWTQITAGGSGGAVSGRYRGAYLAGTAYEANDLVTQAGALYSRITAGTPSGAFVSGQWNLVTTSGGTTVFLNDLPLADLHIDDDPITPPDIGASAVTRDGVPIAVLGIIGEVDPVLSSEKGVAGGVARLSSTGQVLDAGGNPVSGTGAPDATTSTKGVVRLTNDLAGTAAAPTVVLTGPHGVAINALIDSRAPSVHTHVKADITDLGALASPRIDSALATLATSPTTLESDLADLVVPANVALAGDEFEFEVQGDLFNNSGGTVSVNLRVYINSLIMVTGAQNLTASANRRSLRVRCRYVVRGSSDESFSVETYVTTGATVGGTPAAPLLTTLSVLSSGTLANNLTADTHFRLTATFSVANALVEARRFSALLNRRQP